MVVARGLMGVVESGSGERVAQFAKPNILYIKLGTVLYDEGATRMEETARKTTSLETGGEGGRLD